MSSEQCQDGSDWDGQELLCCQRLRAGDSNQGWGLGVEGFGERPGLLKGFNPCTEVLPFFFFPFLGLRESTGELGKSVGSNADIWRAC